MKKFHFFFPIIKKYNSLIFLMLLLNIVLSILSTLSVAIILPVMRLLFSGTGLDSTSGDIIGKVASTGFLQNIKENILAFIQTIILSPSNKSQSLLNLSYFVISIFVLKNFVKYIAYVLNTYIDENILKTARDLIFSKLIHLPLSFHNNTNSSELINIINNDIPTANGALIPSIAPAIRLPVEILSSLIILITFSPLLTVISFSTSIFSVWFVRVLRNYIKKYSSRIQESNVNMLSRLQESFHNIRIVKAYSNENYETQRYKEQTSWFVKNSMKFSRVANLNSPTSEIFAIVALMAVLFVGGNQVINNELKADELITFLFILFSMMQPITALLSLPTNIQRGEVSAVRINNFIEKFDPMLGGEKLINDFKNEIKFENVSFSYNSNNQVLDKVSFSIIKGQTIALVGASGGGKSTIMDLLQRLYDTTNGSIYIDGENIKNFNLNSYRNLFGIVTQDPILFNDTVENNIKYSKLNADEDELISASKTANAFDFISSMEDKFKTLIGERGVLLSGGQKQRLAIARAIIRNPKILLFDEATSALDTESEALVQSAINNLLVDRTALIIAHRLSTIKNADKIIVVENGKIVESGNHEDLLKLNGTYSKLYNIQFEKTK